MLKSLYSMAVVCVILLRGSSITCAADAEHSLPAAELAEGWIQLFDGETLFGWQPSSDADWHVHDKAIVVATGKAGLLNTTSDFGDYQLRLEYRAPADTNSGIFLRTTEKPKSVTGDCYELNICPASESPFPTGSFVGRIAVKPDAVPELAADAWHKYDVTAKGGHFVILLDGKEVLNYTDPKPIPRGRIGLQLNHGAVQFRNIRLRPLGLTPLLNGKDLTGWKIGEDSKSTFTPEPDGTLHVVNGSGRLESEQSFGDFVAQWEVKTNGKNLNSGVFFRCIPGENMNGYECQIHNGYQEQDRSKPIDGGSGGIYRRQPARRVVSDDLEWTHMTLIASGKHMAAWVNGYQVTDWTDPRPAHDNPRNGSRTAAGTLALQGHDPTTDLLFRNIRAVEVAAPAVAAPASPPAKIEP